MREYNEDKLVEVICNKCNRKITVENDIIKEGVFSVDYKWGYFSKKDGFKHSFDLCEECYDNLVLDFKTPVIEDEYSELI